MMTLPLKDPGVAAGELGNEEYVVVQVEDSRVMVWVIKVGVGSGAGVP
jgi:hypothetical protein